MEFQDFYINMILKLISLINMQPRIETLGEKNSWEKYETDSLYNMDRPTQTIFILK